MTISTSTAQAIFDLVNNDFALLEDLRNSASKQELSKKLAIAAHANGISIDETVLDRELDLAISLYAKNRELSDGQLEEVSGGIGTLALLSGLFVLGALTAAATGAGVATATTTVGAAAVIKSALDK